MYPRFNTSEVFLWRFPWRIYVLIFSVVEHGTEVPVMAINSTPCQVVERCEPVFFCISSFLYLCILYFPVPVIAINGTRCQVAVGASQMRILENKSPSIQSKANFVHWKVLHQQLHMEMAFSDQPMTFMHTYMHCGSFAAEPRYISLRSNVISERK